MRSSVLFVCLGNICRSPTAHVVFREQVRAAGLEQQVLIDSAGTGDWHVGEAPDRRATAAALNRGYDMRDLRARQVEAQDFRRFDYVLAMDHSNLHSLRALCPGDFAGTLDLFLRFGGRSGYEEVPDPYFGGEHGFELVMDLVEDACAGLLSHVRRRLRE